jgi:hypothetical protein
LFVVAEVIEDLDTGTIGGQAVLPVVEVVTSIDTVKAMDVTNADVITTTDKLSVFDDDIVGIPVSVSAVVAATDADSAIYPRVTNGDVVGKDADGGVTLGVGLEVTVLEHGAVDGDVSTGRARVEGAFIAGVGGGTQYEATRRRWRRRCGRW